MFKTYSVPLFFLWVTQMIKKYVSVNPDEGAWGAILSPQTILPPRLIYFTVWNECILVLSCPWNKIFSHNTECVYFSHVDIQS